MDFLDTDFLESEEIKLILESTAEGNPEKNWLPAYHFLICDKNENPMGNLRQLLKWADKYQRDNLVEIKELLIPYSYKLINIEGEDTQ